MEEVRAIPAGEAALEVVATTTRAGLMLGFGLGEGFEVGLSRGLASSPSA